MEQRLRDLLEKARSGGPDDGQQLAHYLRRHPPEIDFLVALANADEEPFRLAAAAAARGRTEPEIIAAVANLAQDEADVVRITLARAWAEAPDWAVTVPIAVSLLTDAVYYVRQSAAEAAKGRDALVPRLLEILAGDPSWEVRQAAARSLESGPPEQVVPALLHTIAHDDDQDVQMACAQSAESHLAILRTYPQGADLPEPSVLETCAERLKTIGPKRYPEVMVWVGAQLESAVDPARLARFGTDLTADAEAGRLDRAHGADDACKRVREALEGAPPHAAVLIGDSGTGKTAVVHELVHQLAEDPDGPWRVLRMSPSEVLVGTKFIGEWETKLQDLIDTVRFPRRVLLYVPSVHELSQVGQSSKTDHNVASMLAPHIESGAVRLLGETTKEAFRAGLGAQPQFRRLFNRIELEPKGSTETRAIAAAVAAEADLEVSDTVLDRVLELAAFYLPGTAEPGRAVGLLRQVLDRHDDAGTPLDASEIVDTLSATTGVPVEMVDDDRSLDLDEIRSFFESRVRGQASAVSAMVDLVSLIKAGLTDPTKPYGIYLFIGPTGVGKTELARALAERLFGDAARLRRFDMSEYATFSSYERLTGSYRNPGLLTEAVRETPFSVFLLDEIEKAHVNVFDLCLQIFDAGRLTDYVGRTADFRRTIFIMTSNLGSAVPTEKAVGFGASEPPPPDAASTMRSLRLHFRPEFLGRIDRIVHFSPLGEETAEWIARREVERVLERSGIARRQLTIDVDPSVLSFLLRRGYSPALGARPLKRTVERCVLLPVARAVATGSVEPGSILRLTARGTDVRVEIEAPDADEAPGSMPPSAPPALRELAERADRLVEEVASLKEGSAPHGARRTELLARSRAEGFWDDQAEARRVLGEIQRWDGVFRALGTLERRVTDTQRHVSQATTRRQRIAKLAERIDELEAEAARTAALLTTKDAHHIADALITVTRVKAEGRGLDAVERVARMYLAYARRHELEVEVIDDHRLTDPHADAISLLVTGAGAHGLLAPEAGLHQFVRRAAPPAGTPKHRRGRPRMDRELVRVDVWPAAEEEERIPDDELRVKSRALQGEKGRLIRRPACEVTIVHVPSMHAVTGWGEGTQSDVVGRLLPLLLARVAQAGEDADRAASAVRRYELGASPLVRDRRTGRQTGRLDRVLAGDLDVFLGPR